MLIIHIWLQQCSRKCFLGYNQGEVGLVIMQRGLSQLCVSRNLMDPDAIVSLLPIIVKIIRSILLIENVSNSS